MKRKNATQRKTAAEEKAAKKAMKQIMADLNQSYALCSALAELLRDGPIDATELIAAAKEGEKGCLDRILKAADKIGVVRKGKTWSLPHPISQEQIDRFFHYTNLTPRLVERNA